MKKLIFSKFLKDTMKFFLIISLSLSLIVWVMQSVNYLDLMSEDGHGLNVYFSYSLLNFPKIFHRLLPFVFFLSLFYQISQYENHNELIIFWSNGVSKIQFVNVIVLFSILITILQIFLGSYISPLSQNKARSYLKDSSVDFFPSLIQEGKFIDTVSDLTIFIDSKDDQGIFNNIFLNDSSNTELTKVIYAKKGFLVNESGSRFLRLIDGKMINEDKSKSNLFAFDKIDFDLTKYHTKTITFPKIQETSSPILLKCLVFDFKNKIEYFKEKNFNCENSTLKNVKQELLKRLYIPIYLPLIAIACCILIIRSKESENYNRFKSILFMILFLIIVISEMSLRYSVTNQSGFIFFLLLPILSFIIIYTYFIRRNKI